MRCDALMMAPFFSGERFHPDWSAHQPQNSHEGDRRTVHCLQGHLQEVEDGCEFSRTFFFKLLLLLTFYLKNIYIFFFCSVPSATWS